MTVQVKICGLKTKEALDTAIKNGANLIGFVFFENSPRNVSLVDAADFCQYSQGKVERVGLMVNPNDEFISAILNIVSLDLIQLHGSESPSRVSEIKTHFRVPIMKACSIVDESDVKSARIYENVADRLLFDAKSPKYSSRPGTKASQYSDQIPEDVKQKRLEKLIKLQKEMTQKVNRNLIGKE